MCVCEDVSLLMWLLELNLGPLEEQQVLLTTNHLSTALQWLFFLLCVWCMSECVSVGHACARAHVWRSKDHFRTTFQSRLRDWIQVAWLNFKMQVLRKVDLKIRILACFSFPIIKMALSPLPKLVIHYTFPILVVFLFITNKGSLLFGLPLPDLPLVEISHVSRLKYSGRSA